MRTISWKFGDKASDTFEIYPDTSGKFRCRLMAANSDMSAVSMGYGSETSYTMIDKRHFVRVF